MSYCYRIFGLIVKSDLELPEAETVENSDEISIELIYYNMMELDHEIEEYSEKNRSEQNQKASVTLKLGKEISIVHVRNIGLFRITGGNKIEYMPYIDKQSTLFHHWLLAMAFGIVFIQRESVTLHGACLTDKDKKGAFIISGVSGSGKSTLSDELLKDGCLFMSDDMVLLEFEESICGVPSYPQRRLCKDIVENQHMNQTKLHPYVDGGKEKFALDMGEDYYNHKMEIKALFVISVVDAGSEPEIIEINGNEKLNYVIRNMYKIDSYKMIGITPNVLHKCIRFAKEVPIYEIRRPKGVMTVKRLDEMLLQTIKNMK